LVLFKTLLIGWREFHQRVRSRGFVLSSIGTPLFFLVIWAISGLAAGDTPDSPLTELAQARRTDTMIGYVDPAGVIQTLPEAVPPHIFRPFPNVAAAETALLNGEVEAYYVIPANYRQSGQVRRVSSDLPVTPPDDLDWLNWVLVGNLLPDASSDQLARLRWPFNRTGPEFVAVSSKGDRGGEGIPLFPMFVVMAVLLPLFTSGGYLFQSLIQEKDSRIMEILLVSVRPQQLLTGKLLGLGTLTVVQYVIWAVIGLLSVMLTGGRFSTLLSEAQLSGNELLWLVPYTLGGFTLYAALMAGIGALAPDLDNSRVWMFIITLPMLIPLYLWIAIVSAPDGPLAVALSLFPFSAPVAMPLRLTATTIPAWQLGLSLGLLFLTSVGMVWLMARLFRAQTLLSGEALSLRRLWSALRSSIA
jgi:ABC-2 type transport system permease protein